MSGREQAVQFAEALFAGRPDGSLIAVSIAPDWGKPHFVRGPDDVAQYAADKRDVYVRHTPVTERPKQGKRGDERLSAALLGIVQDLDVDGSPDGRGGTIENACPDRDAALDLAEALLVPTLLVDTGYGIHAYYLLAEPFLIGGDADALETARALTRGWQARMKRLARERGIGKLDSVGDLARVMRVPGSLNTKGAEPVPVTLLDDGGPRYALDELREYADAVNGGSPQASRVRTADPDSARALLERHPDLDRLARRKGKKVGDGSASDWDFALACRAAEDHDLDDDALAALIRYARTLHPDPKEKGESDDYVERTVAAARERVGYPANASLGESIARRWSLGTSIVEGWAVGHGEAARIYLRLADGRELVFPRMADFFNADAHVRRVSLIARCKCPSLKKADALAIAQDIAELCNTAVDPEEELRETEGWVAYFISTLGTVTAGELSEPGRARWDALDAVKTFAPTDPKVHREIAARTAAILDSDGRLWIPAEALMRHVRSTERATIDWGSLRTRMAALGWSAQQIRAYEPDVPRGEDSRICISFFHKKSPEKEGDDE